MLSLQGASLSCWLHTKDLSPGHHCLWHMLSLGRKDAIFFVVVEAEHSPEQIADVDEY